MEHPANTLVILYVIGWTLIPAGGVSAYYKLAWHGNPPVIRTQKQMLKISAASLFLFIVLLGASALDAPFRFRSPATYFGLAFPHPPGVFFAVACMVAITGVLLAIHAFLLKATGMQS